MDDLPDTPHLLRYVKRYQEESGREIRYREALRADDDETGHDLVYPIGEELYIHLKPQGTTLRYMVIEPELTEEDQDELGRIREKVFDQALYRPPPEDLSQLETELLDLYEDVTQHQKVSKTKDSIYRYYLIRDIARYGPLQPFTQDPYLEDIQAVGTSEIHVIHKYFDMLMSNVKFRSPEHLDAYIRNLSERIGRPVSDARPIVDATLADGSRINIVYSEDVSRRGPSFSIRRVHKDPISITQLVAWKTITAEIGAYIWLCLENGMNVFVCGEAACGKSATLNAILPFVNPRDKVYSAEDTPEVRPPHPVWQRLLTRETGPKESRVEMFDLLKAALRSRPNYIIVGEIRGAEGAVAFQGMQTGHPSVATFHATDKVKMIQRLSSPPINIPLTFIDNLNVAVFQQALYKNGRLIRRVTSIDEIQGFSELDGGVITLPVFGYNPSRDKHTFQGKNNSYILEKKIAEQHGYEDPMQIYVELERRAMILKAMVEHEVFQFDEVNRLIFAFHDNGVDALPFDIPGLPEVAGH